MIQSLPPRASLLTRRTALAAAALLSAPMVVTAATVRLRLGVDPGGAVGAQALAEHAVRLASRAAALSDGQLRLEMLPVALAPGAGLGAVAAGQIDAALGAADAWRAADAAFPYFARIPMGLSPGEYEAWVLQAEGAALMDRLGLAFDVRLLPAGDGGARPAGWFRRSPAGDRAFAGVSIAASGLGAELLPALGARVLPRDQNPEGVEGGNTAQDAADGLPARYPVLATPALLSPQTAITLVLSRGLPEREVNLLAAAALSEAETLVGHHAPLPQTAAPPIPIVQSTLQGLAEGLWTALGDTTAGHGALPALFDSYMRFLVEISAWSAIGEGAFAGARARALAA